MRTKSNSWIAFFSMIAMMFVGGAVMAEGVKFRVWATSDAHVDSDLAEGRASLADAILDSELGGDEGGAAFEWDIMLHLGDALTRPDAAGYGMFQDQIAVMTRHLREDAYFLAGNTDAMPEQTWFVKGVDPMGQYPELSAVDNALRPYPVEGTWDAYEFHVGNVLFLMLSDRNALRAPYGRGDGSQLGYPAGAVTQQAFDWWVSRVEANQDKIIVTASHHVLEDTTVASGIWEGCDGGYHAETPGGAPEGASFLYFLPPTAHSRAFVDYLEAHPGTVDLWLGGHTHTVPDDRYGGKGHIEKAWGGVTFINVAGLTKFHSLNRSPMSRLLTFEDGSKFLSVRLYLHSGDYAAEGWYETAERRVRLRHRFETQP